METGSENPLANLRVYSMLHYRLTIFLRRDILLLDIKSMLCWWFIHRFFVELRFYGCCHSCFYREKMAGNTIKENILFGSGKIS